MPLQSGHSVLAVGTNRVRRDLRSLPLVDRKQRLERLVSNVRDNWLCYSETFTDGATLIKATEVSKKANAPYRSGSKCDFIKVKCHSWREANRERWRLLNRVNFRSVADGQFEWQGENRLALFVCDDK